MNKTLLVIIIVLLLAGGGYVIMKMQPSYTPSPSIAPASESSSSVTSGQSSSQQQVAAVIKYTDSGFVPSSVIIKKGETVEWINNSNIQMWVASNPHPTHTDYPGFDELSSAAKGGTYQFTFTKTGSWGYHNHNNPSDHAAVIVQ